MTTMTVTALNAQAFHSRRVSKTSVSDVLANLSSHKAFAVSTVSIVVRAGLAVVPFAGLAWLFVAV